MSTSLKKRRGRDVLYLDSLKIPPTPPFSKGGIGMFFNRKNWFSRSHTPVWGRARVHLDQSDR